MEDKHMTTLAGQRQRAEAMVAKYEAWIKAQPFYMQMPTLREMDKLVELFMEARQEALREAVSIVEDWPLGIEDRLGLLDRLACEAQINFVASRN